MTTFEKRVCNLFKALRRNGGYHRDAAIRACAKRLNGTEGEAVRALIKGGYAVTSDEFALTI